MHDAQLVGFVAGARHRSVGELGPVGREHGADVGALVRGGEVARLLRCRRAAATHRSRFVDHASSRPASRAVKTRPRLSGVNVNSSAPPNGLDGPSASMPFITSIGRGRVRRLVEHVDRRDEEVRAPPVLPRVPVAEQQRVVEAAGRLALLGGGDAIGRAGQVRAVDVDLERDRELPPVGREPEGADVERILRHLRRLAGLAAGHPPDLGRAAARRQEVDGLPVRAPHRAGVAGGVGGQADRRSAVPGIDGPDVGATPVRLAVERADRERQPRVGARAGELGQPVHRDEILHGEAGRRRQGGGPGGDHEGNDQAASHASYLLGDGPGVVQRIVLRPCSMLGGSGREDA